MRDVSNITGPSSTGKASREDRDLTSAFTGKDEYQEIIKKAEAFPLLKLFKKYNLHIDAFNRKSVCPFPSHKGGRESTASFYFYPETNSFWCFGCKTGRSSVDFVSKFESLNKLQSALKIIKNNDGNFEFPTNFQDLQDDYAEKCKIHFDFSKKMRDILQSNPEMLANLEEIYYVFDKMNSKYELELSALNLLVERLSKKVEEL